MLKFANLMCGHRQGSRWVIILLVGLLSTSVLAKNGINKKPATGPAIHGYDPVAYFVAGESQRGDKAFSYDYQDVTWQFSNEENKQSFIESPKHIFLSMEATVPTQPAKTISPTSTRTPGLSTKANFI